MAYSLKFINGVLMPFYLSHVPRSTTKSCALQLLQSSCAFTYLCYGFN